MKARARLPKTYLAALPALLVALLLTACGANSTATPATSSPTATRSATVPAVTATATPSTTSQPATDPSPMSARAGRAHPPHTRTGIAQVDAVLDAIEGGEGVDLLGLIAVDRLPCAPGATVGAPACPSGFAPGDVVAAFRGGACDPQFYVGRSIADLAGSFVALAPRLYAVYRDPSGPGYGIVFAERPDGTGTASSVIVGDDGAVHALYLAHCGATAAEWLGSGDAAGSVVFPPVPG